MPNPKKPQPASGYAYMADDTVNNRNFRRVSSERWTTVLITPAKAGPWRWLGTREIDGTRCNVWRVIESMTGSPVWYAQSVVGC
jgi:hypothetical protein